MNHQYILYTVAFQLIELLAVTGIVFWIARCWRTKPDALIVRFIRHRYQVWFALLLFFLPIVIGEKSPVRNFMWPTALAGAGDYTLIEGVILNLIYGIGYGVAGCLFAATKGEGRFYHWLAWGIAVAPILFFSGIAVFGSYVSGDVVALVFVTFIVTFPERNSKTSPEVAESQKIKSPALALSLACLPSVMFFSIKIFADDGNPSAVLLILCSIISIICCFVSSFMLFRRGIGLAMFGGILFLILNATISISSGYGAILTQMKD